MSDLYKDGSLAQQNFTTGYDYAKWSTDGSNNLIGSFVWEGPGYIGKDAAENYVGIHALEGPNGDKVAGVLGPPAKGIFGFVITNKTNIRLKPSSGSIISMGRKGLTLPPLDLRAKPMIWLTANRNTRTRF